MDTELFELCKEVYKRTEWGKTRYPHMVDTNQAWFVFGDGSNKEFPYVIDGRSSEYQRSYKDGAFTPLYTSDYLLEKLPKGLTTFYGQAYPLSPQVMASGDMYYAMYKHDMTGPNSEQTSFEVEADTPLKALLKLTIALDDAGDL